MKGMYVYEYLHVHLHLDAVGVSRPCWHHSRGIGAPWRPQS